MSRNGAATIQMVVQPTLLGLVTNVALVKTDDNDPVSANNASVVTANVVLAPGVLENPLTLDIPSIGTASLYPSTVTVSGLTGKVGKVTVTLHRLTHTFPSDLDILLVGPRGQAVILMSRVGAGNPVNNATFTFDDGAANFISQSFLQSGAYKPRNLSAPTDNLPSPAPTAPYADSLSAFAGTDPNGVWSLYVADHGEGDFGALEAGWTMVIETAPELKIRRAGGDILLTWPTASSGYLLQGTSEFSTNFPWTNLGLVPVVIGSENVVTNQATNQLQFFRLIR
jgi:subtilisin-like proprotein convertase family protein